MNSWTLVEFKNAGPDSSLRVPYKDKGGKARIGNMGSPWRKAANSVDRNGNPKFHNLADLLPAHGFVAMGMKRISLPNFSGLCEEYRIELYGVLRQSWYFRKSGVGYAWTVYWNFPRLKQLLKRLEFLRAKERLYLSNLIEPRPRGIPTEQEFDQYSNERSHYSLLAQHLTQTNSITHMTFVAIPGFSFVVNEDHRALLIRLYRILSEWPWKQSAPKGPRRSTRLSDKEKSLVAEKYKSNWQPTRIADLIAWARDGDLGTMTLMESSSANEALVKQVRRTIEELKRTRRI